MKTIHKSAIFSPCRTWRYSLTRIWDLSLPLAMFIGLNPSTATEVEDDPTVRRCQGYVRAWGLGGLLMTNLFAFRATDPQVMKVAGDPVGSENDTFLREPAKRSSVAIVLCAWGNHGAFRGRSREVVDLLQQAGVELMCLRLTKTGEPGHPLYLPKNLQPIKMF